jgi:NADP-dependent 3-hydroxy acid dehydrogenase YdfG
MNNKIWLITGISSGLGKALAESVIESGDFVIGTFRQQSQVEEFNNRKTKNAQAILLEITNDQSIEVNIKKIISEHGKIDVLVNNAGIGFVGAIEETSMAEVRTVFEPNFFGTLKT